MSETRGDVTGGGLAEVVLALADEWEKANRESPRNYAAGVLAAGARDLRAAVAAATAGTPPTPDVVTFRVVHCDVTTGHGEHAYDYEGPILWCDGADR